MCVENNINQMKWDVFIINNYIKIFCLNNLYKYTNYFINIVFFGIINNLVLLCSENEEPENNCSIYCSSTGERLGTKLTYLDLE